ncbi:hypothetical protein pipiens_008419 [Culex pipiens pipiens]|uniref:Phenylalanine--tRNA ligase beta subunit B1 domain-containing protein n=2 Tax=Culex pipiens pipiens TaxID=38569 RepID=A0ABD1DHY5_CULPP
MRRWTVSKNGLRIHKFQLIIVGPGEKLCCEFDLELDEVMMEKQKITKEQGAVDAAKDASEDDQIDIPANRYDLLCPGRQVQGLQLEVFITPTQHDMLHVHDIYEDVANAYGYNRFPKTLPATMHIARHYPLNKLTEQLREQIAQAGFTENLAFMLPSRNDRQAEPEH